MTDRSEGGDCIKCVQDFIKANIGVEIEIEAAHMWDPCQL